MVFTLRKQLQAFQEEGGVVPVGTAEDEEGMVGMQIDPAAPVAESANEEPEPQEAT